MCNLRIAGSTQQLCAILPNFVARGAGEKSSLMYDDVFAPCKNPGLLLGSGVWEPLACCDGGRSTKRGGGKVRFVYVG